MNSNIVPTSLIGLLVERAGLFWQVVVLWMMPTCLSCQAFSLVSACLFGLLAFFLRPPPPYADLSWSGNVGRAGRSGPKGAGV